MSDNIKVGIKVRPLIKREEEERLPIQWVVEDNHITLIDPDTGKMNEAQFHFDYIFDMGKTNEEVFNATAKPIVEAALNGINGTIFTYGQTGSGKTYTMLGSKTEKGVIHFTVDYIFNFIRNDWTREYLLRVSYIEIYNEKINDLLEKSKTDLKIKEDFYGHITVDCKEEVASSVENIMHAMKRGEKLKRTGETNMNERSSRSHTIFRITIESCDKNDPEAAQKEAQLNLIDLAGSERARLTGATGERFNEGRHINLSLSTLSLVIKQLSEPNSTNKFVNYRDSKLTRILQPSLGGNALTTIICTVTPAALDETQCTLDFAVRAKGVKNKPQVNETISDQALLKKVLAQVRKLQDELLSKNTEIEEAKKEKDDREHILQARIKNLLASIASTSLDDKDTKIRRRRTWAGGNATNIPVHKFQQFALPTIHEISGKPKSNGHHEKSLIELDLNSDNFKTDLPDFELQLIKDQQEKCRLSTASDDDFLHRGLTVRTDRLDNFIATDEMSSPDVSPKKDTLQVPPEQCTCESSPGTPKIVLRKKFEELRSEFDSLREFALLEKQSYQDCVGESIPSDDLDPMAFMKKSLEDTEFVCMDINKKYSELQSDHAILSSKHEQLLVDFEKISQENQSLVSIRDLFASIESERNDYKNKLNEALNRLSNLEAEASSHAYEVELLKAKHKNREKELEMSLNLAWRDNIDPQEKENSSSIVHLHSVINKLTEKISSLEKTAPTNSEISEDLNSKLMEMEKAFKESEEERLALKASVRKVAIKRYEEQIRELEDIVLNKIAENEDEINKNSQLSKKFIEIADQFEINKNIVITMKKEIDCYGQKLEEKVKEIAVLKKRIEEIDYVDKISTTIDSDEFHPALSEEALSRNHSRDLLENQANNKSITELNKDLLKHNVEDQKSEISRLEKMMENKSNELSSTIASFEEEMNALQAVNDKFKEQVVTMQSDRTLHEGEKTALQLTIQDLNEQLKKFNKLETQLTFVTAEKAAHEDIITDLRKQLNEKLLELEEQHSHNYEAEIKNLNTYITEMQSFMKNVQEENDNLKKEVEKVSDVLKNLKKEKQALADQLDVLKQSLNGEKCNETEMQNLIKTIQEENYNLKGDVEKVNIDLKNMEEVHKSLLNELESSKPQSLDIKEMQTRVQCLQVENETFKKHVELVNISLQNLEDEKKSLISQLEYLKQQFSVTVSPKETSELDNNQNSTLNDSKCTSRISEVKPSVNSQLPNDAAKIQVITNDNSTPNQELETSSIFANESYFDNMSDVSTAPGDVTNSMLHQNSFINQSNYNNIITLGIKNDLDETKNLLNFTYGEILSNLHDRNTHELIVVVQELYRIKNSLTEKNEKLTLKLEFKIRESNEIKNDFYALKSGIEELERTVLLLTNENTDMVEKLFEEKARVDEAAASFRRIQADLTKKIKDLEEEKQLHEQNLIILTTKLEKIDGIKLEVNEEQVENMDKMIEEYTEKLKILTEENEELSGNLMEKIEELETIRTTKSLQFDHECKYREKADYFMEKYEILERENSDLSHNLMDKIEELDILTEAYESLKQNVTPEVQKQVDDQMQHSRLLEKSSREKMNISSMSLISDKSIKNNSNSPSLLLEKSISEIIERYDENEQLLQKIGKLESQITELKDLNTKLSSMQLTSCKQCIHLAELNETRRSLRNEIKSANKRLQSLQTKFEQECASGEKLRNKVKEDMNSSLNNSFLNGSYFEGIEVMDAEEQVDRLQTDLESLQERYKSLSVSYKDKCEEFDKLHNRDDYLLESSLTLTPERVNNTKRYARLEKLQNALQKYSDNHQQLSKSINRMENALQKMQNKEIIKQTEIESLKAEKELIEEKLVEAETRVVMAQEEVKILQSEVKSLERQVGRINIDNKDLTEQKSALEEQIRIHKDDEEKYNKIINELHENLAEVNDKNDSLLIKMEVLKSNTKDNNDLSVALQKCKQNVQNLEAQVRELMSSLQSSEDTKSILQSELNLIKSTASPNCEEVDLSTNDLSGHKLKVESLELSVKDLREKLGNYAKENVHLANEITKMRSENKVNLNESDNKMEVCDESFYQDKDRTTEELNAIRAVIVRELQSLGTNLNSLELNGKTVTDVFCIFVNALLAKEQEVVKTLHRRFENEKSTIEEEKKQLIDAEKRVNVWAKELEASIERLESELSEEESKRAALHTQISELNNLLMDANHDKQLMKDKMMILETDFTILQHDLERHRKSKDPSFILQEKDKLIQEVTENCKADYQTKMSQSEKAHKKRIDELTNSLEHAKTKNMELMGNIEGLEANKRQLESIKDIKINELNKANSTVQQLQRQLDDLTQLHNQSNEDNQAKGCRIEEIMGLLKDKCNKMSEYRIQLETITPEYEELKEQAAERQLRLEKYKSEVEDLRAENTKQISVLKDELDTEKIKSAGLTKQLVDITNRNTAVQIELEQLKEKCEELNLENERLVKKMRNSISKVTVERNMEELKDEHRSLSKSLEGANNRIEELQMSKGQLMKEHVELQGQYNLSSQEVSRLKSLLENYKEKVSSPDASNRQAKYDALVQEKNKIALELEEKRLIVPQLEKKLAELTKEHEKLKIKNKDLDDEMEDMLNKIHELDKDNCDLSEKLYKIENKGIQDNNASSSQEYKDINTLQRLYDNLKRDFETTSMTCELLRTENVDLMNKLSDKTEGGRVSGGSKHSSPATTRSRQRRSDLFNQNRPLDIAEDIDNEGKSEDHMNIVENLQQDLVLKSAKIASLELSLENSIIPYRKKCAQYEEALKSYHEKNNLLGVEIKTLRDNYLNCEKCKKGKIKYCDKEMQTEKDKTPLWMNGIVNRGIVEEEAKETYQDQLIKKLQKDKDQLKKLSLSRLDQIRELRKIVEEREDSNKNSESQLKGQPAESSVPNTKYKNSAKENVPSNVLRKSQMIPHRYWFD